MVGSACWRLLISKGYTNIIGKTSKELDLRDQNAVENFIQSEKPFAVIDAAARVGGILANDSYPYQFLMENMQIQNNLIDSALKFDVNKFIFLGSSCIYPKFSDQPIKENYLLTGSLEPTNEWYAIAKISGLKACEAIKKQLGKDFVCLMPTNLYGPNDNFDSKSSHVLPAMINKFHESKKNNKPVNLWGTGLPKREFLFVDDIADAIFFALENELQESLYNVGTGKDVSIKELSKIIQEIIGHNGEILWDESKPDGTPRKLLDVSRLKKLGWSYKTELHEGIKKTYTWYLKNLKNLKKIKL